MNRFDVAVVGGGPVGGYVAGKIASSGYRTAIFEEHNKIGEPLRCAGLVSPRIFDLVDVGQTNIVQNKIYGANIYSPSGNVLTIGGDRVHALVVNRSTLDESLVNSAREKGVEVFLGSRISYGRKKEDFIELDVIKDKRVNQTECLLLIGADGSGSPVRDLFGFPQPNEMLRSIGAEVANVDLDPRFVEIFLGRSIAPGFFAWIIPLNKHGSEARIGLCVENKSKHLLKQCFLNLLKTRQLQNAGILRYIGGSIPLGPLKKTTQSNVMLVGDAAAQVKPTSGGGVYPGLVCARCCASVAVEALDEKDIGGRFLSRYHRLWSKEIGKELSLGMRFRGFFRNLDDEQIDKILNVLGNEKSVEVIGEYGDIDYPSKLVFPLLKACPSLLKFLPSVFKFRKSSFYFDDGGGGT